MINIKINFCIYRVRGIEHLRVVDASVMPQPTNANTNAPTMLIAEKIASEIKTLYEIDYPESAGGLIYPLVEKVVQGERY
jgi:hypothetical protein